MCLGNPEINWHSLGDFGDSLAKNFAGDEKGDHIWRPFTPTNACICLDA